MHQIEHFICGKENNPDTCEDGLVIGTNIIAVIDGVTSKGSRLWDGKTSGCYAKEVLLEYLRQQDTLPESISEDLEKSQRKVHQDTDTLHPTAQQSAAALLRNLDGTLREKSRDRFPDLPEEEYPRASVIIYHNQYKEIWSYGDCQCRINDEIHTHTKAIDELNASLRAFYLEYELSCGRTLKSLMLNDPGREAIRQNLQMQFSFENMPGAFGYPVLNGAGIEESMLKRYPAAEGDTVILASDGYPILESTLEKSEAALHRILDNDPMCFLLYRSTKGIKPGNISFDDRTFCRFVI